jgi:hypothetical protein
MESRRGRKKTQESERALITVTETGGAHQCVPDVKKGDGPAKQVRSQRERESKSESESDRKRAVK